VPADRLATDKPAPIDGAGARKLLESCVERGIFGQLYCPSANYACSGCLHSLQGDLLVLTLDRDTDAKCLSILGLCSLYFSVDGYGYLALSRLISVQKISPTQFKAVIETPTHMSRAEPRSSARLAVPKDCDFHLFVFNDGRLQRAKPINVSLGGMLLDLGEPIVGITPGIIVQVQGSWDGVSLNMPALVRWVDGTCCGVFFNTIERHVHTNACPELMTIVERLLNLQERIPA
jgi:hypothetical protein